MPAKTSKTT
jgi:hypothetical protein